MLQDLKKNIELNYKGKHNGIFLFSFSFINSNNFNMGRGIMRIPNNSNFSKEIAKKFKQIFHRDMTLGGLQDLQEQLDLIDSVDTHLVNQVSQLNKGNGHEQSKKNVSPTRAVRQEYTQGKGAIGKIVPFETKEKGFGF